MIIRIEHLRRAKICMSGARAWFADHDLSWDDFVANGIPAHRVEHLDDAFVDRVLDEVRKEH